MTLKYHYDSKKGILFGEMSTPLTIDELQNGLIELLESDEIPSTVKTIWDFRNLDFTTIDTDFMMQFIDIREKYPQRGNAKIAFVVMGDFAFGMIRMYEGHSTHLPQQTMVFQDYSSALNWLLKQ